MLADGQLQAHEVKGPLGRRCASEGQGRGCALSDPVHRSPEARQEERRRMGDGGVLSNRIMALCWQLSGMSGTKKPC